MAEYIEREAALMELCRGCSLHGISDSFFCGEPCPKYERIASIPPADVQPVRHGRWTDKRTIEHDGEWYCSVCGNEVTICMCGKDKTWDYPYCPNCGAKMDGEA